MIVNPPETKLVEERKELEAQFAKEKADLLERIRILEEENAALKSQLGSKHEEIQSLETYEKSYESQLTELHIKKITHLIQDMPEYRDIKLQAYPEAYEIGIQTNKMISHETQTFIKQFQSLQCIVI